MKNSAVQDDLLSTVEDVLSQHSVFGDSRYVLSQLQGCMRLRLEKIA